MWSTAPKMSGWAAGWPSSSYRRISPATARHWSDSSARLLAQAAGTLGPETVTIPDSSLTATGVSVGTAPYMSPQQACGEEIDTRSDLFSLGTVLCEMVTGVLPFQGKTSVPVMAAIMHRPHLPPRAANPSVPKDLARIIDKALEKDPEMRYQTASDLRADLSPDGNWLSFGSWGRQEDIFVVRVDGAGLRQLTDDVHSDRSPRWSPSGNQIAFFSNRSGKFEIWSIRPDGRKLADFLQHKDGSFTGISVYSFETQSHSRLTSSGMDPIWLSDSRRLLFLDQGRIHLVDSETRQQHEVLSIAPREIALRGFAISRDDRRVYFSLPTTNADVWLLTLQFEPPWLRLFSRK